MRLPTGMMLEQDWRLLWQADESEIFTVVNDIFIDNEYTSFYDIHL